MNQKKGTTAPSILVILVTFIAGLIIGLVVLGWWLWPVSWTGASLDVLDPESQSDYLLAAVDSFAFNSDRDLATQRFSMLGENGPAVLAEIYETADPLSKTRIEGFASAVGASDALTGPESEPIIPAAEQPGQTFSIQQWFSRQPLWLTVCGGGLLVFLVLFLLLLLILQKKPKKQSPSSPQTTVETFDTPQELMTEAAFTEQPNVQESFDESIPDLREFEPEPESQTAIAEGELPDWLTGSVQTENELADLSQPGIETLELSDADIDEIAATEFPFLDMEETKARQMETQTEPSTPEESTKPEITESPDQTFLKFSSDIAKIPGISASDAEKLRLAGITAPLLLLRKGATEQDRMSIADEIGVDKTKVLNWVNYVDILRVKGLSIEDAAALYKAGIRMIADLAMSDPSTLQEQLEAVAEEMDFDYQSPAVDQIENWIEQAKQLPRVVTYL